MSYDPSDWDDLIPDVDLANGKKLNGVDWIKDNFDPLDLYNRWIGKTVGKNVGKGEITFSCPTIEHIDEHPSAWMNGNTGLWTCGVCSDGARQLGGDVIDFAAIHLGFQVPHYRSSRDDFSRIVIWAMEDLGWSPPDPDDVADRLDDLDDLDDDIPAPDDIPADPDSHVGTDSSPHDATPDESASDTAPPARSTPEDALAAVLGQKFPAKFSMPSGTHKTVARAPGSSQGSSDVPDVSSGSSDPDTGDDFDDVVPDDISSLVDPDVDFGDLIGGEGLDWRSAIGKESVFLKPWMDLIEETPAPDEFAFWLGLQMLGLATGRQVHFDPPHMAAYPNFLLCLIGPTGGGKSTAIKFASKLMKDALPYDPEDDEGRGVKTIGRPASGEALYSSFDNMTSGTLEQTSVKALVVVDEFSELVAAATRRGSTLSQAIIQLYDAPEEFAHKTRGSDPIFVKQPMLSMAAGLQPDLVDKVLTGSDVASGFANRFNFVYGPKKPWRGYRQSQVKVDFSPLEGTLANIRTWAYSMGVHQIELDHDAEMFFDDVVVSKIRPSIDKDEMLARFDLHYKKIITALAIDEKRYLVGVDILERALIVLFGSEAVQAYIGRAAGSSKMTQALDGVEQAIHKFYAAKGEWPAESGIKKYLKRSLAQDTDLFKLALERLVRTKSVEMVHPPLGPVGKRKGGRPLSIKYKIAGYQ